MADTDTSEDLKKKQPDALALTMPTLATPLRMNIPTGQSPNTLPVLTRHQADLPAAQRNAISRESYAAGMPKLTAAPFSPEYYQQREAMNAYEKANPWGSAMSTHPGIMGKIGHVASEIGQAAGNALVPGIMERIPGSELNRAAQTAVNEGGFEKAQNAEDKLAIAANRDETAKELADERAREQEELQTVRGTQAENLQTKKGAQASDLEGQRVAGQEQINEEKPKPEKAVTLQLPDGKKAPGKTDQEGNILLADGTAAPKGTMLYQQPNYGQLVLPTKTIQVLGPNGPEVMGWNTKTQAYDIPRGTSASGALGHEMGQAAIVDRDADTLISHIQAHPEAVGNVKAILESAFLNTPLADPVQSQLAAEIGGFAALNPAMHGFRGTDALRQFEHLIGGIPKDEKALIAAIQGFKTTAQEVNPNLKQEQVSGGHKIGDSITQGGKTFRVTKIDKNGKVLAADPAPNR